MPRFSTLFATISKSLLERDDNPFDSPESHDPFRPLDEVRRKRRPVSLPLTAPVGPPNLPKTQNLPDDVGRVEGALGRAGILGGKRQRPVFDTRLQTGVRDFQRQKGLRVTQLTLSIVVVPSLARWMQEAAKTPCQTSHLRLSGT